MGWSHEQPLPGLCLLQPCALATVGPAEGPLSPGGCLGMTQPPAGIRPRIRLAQVSRCSRWVDAMCLFLLGRECCSPARGGTRDPRLGTACQALISPV